MTTVLIAIDQSEASQIAAEAATAIFGPDARYLAINVAADPQLDSYVWGDVYGYPYPPVIPANPEPVDDAEAIASARHAASALAAEAGIAQATAIGEVGDPVEAIVKAAEDHLVDVIVAGWHERGWVRRLFEDSVSEGLVKASPVPVMVVPLDHGPR
jgi:nucleotide-binding universal stress UspA family protein